MVIEHPVLWVTVDANGNWLRIMNKLRLNNLRFEGGKVPSPSAAADAVSEMIAAVVREDVGVDPSFSLPRALSYSAAVKKLEGLGLLTPSVPPSKNKAKPSERDRERVGF